MFQCICLPSEFETSAVKEECVYERGGGGGVEMCRLCFCLHQLKYNLMIWCSLNSEFQSVNHKGNKVLWQFSLRKKKSNQVLTIELFPPGRVTVRSTPLPALHFNRTPAVAAFQLCSSSFAAAPDQFKKRERRLKPLSLNSEHVSRSALKRQQNSEFGKSFKHLEMEVNVCVWAEWFQGGVRRYSPVFPPHLAVVKFPQTSPGFHFWISFNGFAEPNEPLTPKKTVETFNTAPTLNKLLDETLHLCKYLESKRLKLHHFLCGF